MSILAFFLKHGQAIMGALGCVVIFQLLRLRIHCGFANTKMAFRVFAAQHPNLLSLCALLYCASIMGSAMNVLVLGMNNWKMPVLLTEDDADDALAHSDWHCPLTSATQLPFLSDIFLFVHGGTRFHVSMGDFLLLVCFNSGSFVFLVFVLPLLALTLGALPRAAS